MGIIRRIRGGFRRSGTDTAIFPITAPKLAHRLFRSFVLDSEASVMRNYYGEFRQKPGFRQDAFERRDFVYLVANIVVAIGNLGKSDATFLTTIPYLRRLVNEELQRRWPMNNETANKEIGDAAEDLAQLILTNPEADRGLAFKWAQRWLREIGIEESNPVTLARVSFSWQLCHLSVAKFLNRVRVVPE